MGGPAHGNVAKTTHASAAAHRIAPGACRRHHKIAAAHTAGTCRIAAPHRRTASPHRLPNIQTLGRVHPRLPPSCARHEPDASRLRVSWPGLASASVRKMASNKRAPRLPRYANPKHMHSFPRSTCATSPTEADPTTPPGLRAVNRAVVPDMGTASASADGSANCSTLSASSSTLPFGRQALVYRHQADEMFCAASPAEGGHGFSSSRAWERRGVRAAGSKVRLPARGARSAWT